MDIDVEQTHPDLGRVETSVLLERIAREMDRFSIHLLQIEDLGQQVLNQTSPAQHASVSRSLQSIDYLSQASVAISGLLSQMARSDAIGVTSMLQAGTPTDLHRRLQDLDVEDIDNTTDDSCKF